VALGRSDPVDQTLERLSDSTVVSGPVCSEHDLASPIDEKGGIRLPVQQLVERTVERIDGYRVGHAEPVAQRACMISFLFL
jgi:hypothetical protein